MDYLEEADLLNSGKPNEQKRKRKRIIYKPPTANVIEDPLELRANKSSDKARRVFTTIENITIELWFDKHYLDRCQHGDELGKREGIDYNVVENLIKRSLKHLITYSTLIKGFNFTNWNDQTHERVRVIVQEQTKYGVLNVAIEVHVLEINKLEVTVKTAMCKDDFYMRHNQYSIELLGDCSVLKKCQSSSIVEIGNL